MRVKAPRPRLHEDARPAVRVRAQPPREAEEGDPGRPPEELRGGSGGPGRPLRRPRGAEAEQVPREGAHRLGSGRGDRAEGHPLGGHERAVGAYLEDNGQGGAAACGARRVVAEIGAARGVAPAEGERRRAGDVLRSLAAEEEPVLQWGGEEGASPEIRRCSCAAGARTCRTPGGKAWRYAATIPARSHACAGSTRKGKSLRGVPRGTASAAAGGEGAGGAESSSMRAAPPAAGGALPTAPAEGSACTSPTRVSASFDWGGGIRT